MAKIPNIQTASPPTELIPHVYYMDTPAGVNFVPELYVDITPVFDRKVEMVRQHASQASWMKDLFGYELEAFLEIPARFRGTAAAGLLLNFEVEDFGQRHFIVADPNGILIDVITEIPITAA